MPFIKAENLIHKFVRRDDQGEICDTVTALDGVTMQVEEGQFIAVLGRNGSGKSTFAKHLNVLLSPTSGSLWVDGKDAEKEENLWEIRRSAGMIFQNPDNQIVAGVVEEDVAFGPENIGVPTDEIWKRVADSLQSVGMSAYRYNSPNKLSGGQKQRVAIAGVVAMQPKCIIMDEPTAMLDPTGRREVLRTAHELNREKGVTIILITHYMEEVVDADRVFVMDRGRVHMSGAPEEIFARVEELRACGLDLPQMTELAYELRKEGVNLPSPVLSREELLAAIIEKYPFSAVTGTNTDRNIPEKNMHDEEKITWGTGDESFSTDADESAMQTEGDALLRLDHVWYNYDRNAGQDSAVLRDISFDIHRGEYIGLIGYSGSGKSTLVQLLNGLFHPTEGTVSFCGQDISDKSFSLQQLRGKVGLVFQYPEYQLFEVTVEKDAAFGPKNQGFSETESLEKARVALRAVNLDEKYFDQSPFELSGGEKRRAAIAGVLAMEPEVLILDEPAAGLDPASRRDLFALIDKLHEQKQITILLVSHSMEDVAEYAERILVLDNGRIILDGTPKEVFAHTEELERAGLAVPQVSYLMADLQKAGYPVRMVTTLKEAKEELLRIC